ncbi:MAG: trigger factor [Tannerella sp.]|nr:trigger factor [Tannerella sp.]
MNVSFKNNDAVSGILKVEIEKNDYAEQLDKNLHKLRQKVNMPGFRKGKTPVNIIKKLYGKQVLAEEVNKLALDKLFSYIRENNIKILGEPVPNETEQKTIDFDVDENFELCFDIALMPEIEVKLTKEDQLTSYRLKVDDEIVDKQVDSYCKNYGSYDKADKVEEEEDLVKGTIVELEDGSPKTAGIFVEDVVLMLSYMEDDMEQKKLIEAKLGDKIVFNPYKAYNGAKAKIAALMKIDKDAVEDMKSDFSFEIKEITRHKSAELNQELFDRIFGQDAVKSEAEFRDKIKESFMEQFVPESEGKFIKDMRDMLIRKVGDVAFADDILKRWLLVSNEKTTKEAVENDYPKVIEDLKYHLAKKKLVEDNRIKVEYGDIEALGRRIAKSQFARYGILSVPDDALENYTKDLLKKQETANNLTDRAINEKLSVLMKDLITINEKEVTSEEFGKIVKEQK